MTDIDQHERDLTATEALVERYVALWGEPDDETRCQHVRAVWADDAVHVLESRIVEGHTAIAERVAGAYRDLVAEKRFAFTLDGGLRDGIRAHNDAVTFDVTMAPAAGGSPVWSGRMVLLLGPDGRVRRDYQFGRYL